MNMGNYLVLEQIGATAGGTLHLARQIQDGAAVLLKLPARDSAANGLRHEYALLQSLNAPGILHPLALLEDGPRLALVLESFAGESLEAVLARQPRFALAEALVMASQLARALAALHAAGIVHRDLRPANLLLGRDDAQVKLADLSRAASREEASSARPAGAGDWPYVSPEQTGRMHRQVDYRTDFYSLGILLYRLLTGQLPFQADDPLEWAHCHLARAPVPPHQLVPDLPQLVSDLVLKLLAKVPDERYQSADGLLADLERCLSQLQACGRIDPFVLGGHDVPDRLLIPHKLYGRERNIALLLEAFETVVATGTSMLVTISGYSGIGKSALVAELHKPIIDKRGYFITGKFDQCKRNIPYASLAQAFQSLVRQILGESDPRVGQWRDALSEALGCNGQLMVSLIPELEFVIGPQPPVPDLPPQDTQRRFQLIFRQFLGVFATQEHPLVLFLDDLQWMDTATLALLEHLMTRADVRHLLLVCAYRDNEVDARHPLMGALEAIRQAGTMMRNIVLTPLALDDVAQLIADALHCQLQGVMPLAHLVFEKTGGNPFFTRQFLVALAEEKLLSFDASRGEWVWDLKRIQAKGYTDNVVDLMVSKLGRLPQETQQTLQQFACLGNMADVATLSLVLDQSKEAMHATLHELVRMGLIVEREDSYAFLHDRVQEATYSLIPDVARAGMHLRIGRILARELTPEAVAERVFEIVNQLNRGGHLVESPQERERIAELNLMAGKRAKEAAAYASALTYLAAGVELLPEDRWDRHYELSFALELNCAECEFLVGARAQADARLAKLVQRAADLVDLAAVVCLQGELFTTLDQSGRSIEAALDYLRRVGITWSACPTDDDVRREFESVWTRIGDRPVEALVDLPPMTDRVARATMEILTMAGPAALFSNPNLLCLVLARMVNLSLEYGNSDGSCLAYATMAMVLGSIFGDYQSAVRFGRLTMDLMEKHRLVRFEARACLNVGGGVNFWMRHMRTSAGLQRRGWAAAQRAGDLNFMAYAHVEIVSALLADGTPLAEVQREAEAGLEFVRPMQFGLVIGMLTTQLRLTMMLRGLTPGFGCFNDVDFDESEFERHLEENSSLALAANWYWIRKLQARFFAGDYAAALAAATKAQNYIRTSPFYFEALEYRYFTALTHAALCDTASSEERSLHTQALVEQYQHQREWAEICPENFVNRAALIGGELARIEGRDLDAMHLYEQAIRSAHDNGFVHHEAIAHERASAFYRARGFEPFADFYLRNASDCYLRWGATGKVQQLEQQYPQLYARADYTAAASAEGETRLDLLAVAKASQAISSRILLDELIDTLMRLVLESAGAQTGCLLLTRDDELMLAAEARVEQQEVEVHRRAEQTPPQTQVPLAILQYVRRSREPVLLMDASAAHPFSSDPYFAQQHPQSVLCLPILRQSALVGLLYLENSLATHAFTPERLQVLELLASQAAISLDNARLYADVRDSHARIRRLVESNIIGIFFLDLNGNILDANEAFLAMVAYSRQELVAGKMNWVCMTPPEGRALDERKVAEVCATKTCIPYEKEFLRKDGSRIPVLIGAALFDDSPGRGVAFVLDLSERKRAEAEREARHAAEAANRAKSAFLASMSHELRTPLNGILGYAQILKRDPALGERQLAGVNVIHKSGEHLLTLINDVLDLAKIEAGKMELAAVDIPLAPFMQTIAEIVGVKAAQKGLELVCDLAPGLPQGVRADEKRLRQVLLNLLSNAVKFTDRGQVTLRVRFAPPTRLCFEVQDTGIGIAADQLKTIFEPFEQAGDMQRRLAGTGLGLTISRQYVRLMGGEITVESQVGQGSTFRFEVEVQPVQTATAVTASRTVTGYAGPRKKVLVVDDIAENRTVVTDLLTPLGFEMAEASNGREALELAQHLRPDLIIMDIVMPELDGLAATRRLRQLEAFREVPILAMSASISASDSEQSLAAGMNAFLAKPLDADKLLDQMGKLLQLEWTYGPAAQDELPSEPGPLMVPSADEMEVLHRLAKLGNMQEIMAQAERLAKQDERYRPFANLLSSLARNYQSKAVLRLVEDYRQSSLASSAMR